MSDVVMCDYCGYVTKLTKQEKEEDETIMCPYCEEELI